MALSANRIERQHGATLDVAVNSPVAVTQIPDNVGGLLPWMTMVDGSTGGSFYPLFGEVINGQIRTMNRSSIKSNLNTATANDVIGVPAAGRSWPGRGIRRAGPKGCSPWRPDGTASHFGVARE